MRDGRRHYVRLGLTVILPIAAVSAMVSAAPHTATASARLAAAVLPDPCPAVLVIGARGTNEAPTSNGGDPSSYTNAPYHGVGQTLDKMYGQLQSANLGVDLGLEPVVYPTVLNFGSPLQSAPYLFDAQTGGANISQQIQATDTLCNHSVRYILAGYSIGAWAVHDALNSLTPAQLAEIAGVALFGDPKFQPGQPFVREFKSQDTYYGLAYGFDPTDNPIPTAVVPQTGSWCLPTDPICQYQPNHLLTWSSELRSCLPGAKNAASCAHSQYLTDGATLSAVAVLSPFLHGAAEGTTTEFAVPTGSSQPLDITTGPDGNLWFTENEGNKIGRITPSGSITEFAVPTSNSQPYGITAGPDGNLWFTQPIENTGSNQIGRITPNGSVTEFTVPTTFADPTYITSGPDGNLWFTEMTGNKIGRVTTNGTFTEYAVPTNNSFPVDITAGPDGNLWFTENSGNKIGRITPSGSITEFAVPTAGAGPLGITAGPDGNLWFTEAASHEIGKITTAGVITEYAVPTSNSQPEKITTGPDGKLWFTEDNGNKIGRITTSGTITEYAIPGGSGPTGITAGPDGNVWFTDDQGNNIGRIVP
jgi:streptogramin lyase